MGLRNLPTDFPVSLSSLISCHEGQISSMGLVKDANFDMTLLAFAPDEHVSEEEYFGDTFYYVIEGCAEIVLPDRRVNIGAGEAMCVPAHTIHALESDGAFKVLQITV